MGYKNVFQSGSAKNDFSAVCGTVFADAGGDRYADCKLYAVSGVSLVNSFNTVLIFLFDALAAGGAVVISQYIGSRDPEAAGHAGSQLCMFSILFGVVCNWGVIGIAAGMGIDLIIRGAIFVQRMKSREWTKFRVI